MLDENVLIIEICMKIKIFMQLSWSCGGSAVCCPLDHDDNFARLFENILNFLWSMQYGDIKHSWKYNGSNPVWRYRGEEYLRISWVCWVIHCSYANSETLLTLISFYGSQPQTFLEEESREWGVYWYFQRIIWCRDSSKGLRRTSAFPLPFNLYQPRTFSMTNSESDNLSKFYPKRMNSFIGLIFTQIHSLWNLLKEKRFL